MKISARIMLLAAGVLFSWLTPLQCWSKDTASAGAPWEKFGASFGLFAPALDSSFRIGSGLGLSIDAEDLLGLDSTTTAFRTDLLWRFSENRRHRLDFSWFSLNRSGNRIITEDIRFEKDDGTTVVVPAGTGVEGHFDLDIYQLGYSYSFFQDDRVDLAAGLGLYVMPIDFGLSASGLVNESASESFTAPLPVFTLRMDLALTPEWFVRTGSQVFYVEYGSFTGSLVEFRGAVEYIPWQHVGLGLGFDTFNVAVEADGNDWPNVDLVGKFEYNYTALQLYVKFLY